VIDGIELRAKGLVVQNCTDSLNWKVFYKVRFQWMTYQSEEGLSVERLAPRLWNFSMIYFSYGLKVLTKCSEKMYIRFFGKPQYSFDWSVGVSLDKVLQKTTG